MRSSAWVSALLRSQTATELYGPWCFETEASLQAPGIHQCLLPATEVTKMCPDAWLFYTGSGDWMQALMSVCKHFTGGVIFLATLYFRFSMYLLLLIEFWFSETMSSYVAWTGFELGILPPSTLNAGVTGVCHLTWFEFQFHRAAASLGAVWYHCFRVSDALACLSRWSS